MPATAAKPQRSTPIHLPVPLPHGALLGPPPLAAGEDAAAYEGLLGRIAGAIAPADMLEEIWVRDVADLAWDTLRLRRLKACLMTAAAPEGLARLLTPLLGCSGATALAGAWAARDTEAVAQVDDALATAGLSMEAVAAQTLAVRIDDFERIDRMIASAELRRADALCEVERHRAGLAAALRRALAVEDAEFDELDDEEGGRAAIDHAGTLNGRRPRHKGRA
jgi:hypothetical protein